MVFTYATVTIKEKRGHGFDRELWKYMGGVGGRNVKGENDIIGFLIITNNRINILGPKLVKISNTMNNYSFKIRHNLKFSTDVISTAVERGTPLYCQILFTVLDMPAFKKR